jgi:hypothetical protein
MAAKFYSPFVLKIVFDIKNTIIYVTKLIISGKLKMVLLIFNIKC